MTDRQTLTRPDDPNAAEDTESRLDLSLTQVAGGALAAMTAAGLGSRLGVGGTIAGAALASVVAAVAGALYTASLRTTRAQVRTAWRGPTRRRDVAATAAVDVTASAVGEAPRSASLRPRFPWRRALVGTVAVFGLAGVLLTSYEALAGQALSGGSGTTVEQVSSGRSSDSRSDDKDAKEDSEQSDDSSPSPKESSEPESGPSSEGSKEASTEPGAGEPDPAEANPAEPRPRPRPRPGRA